MAQSSNTDKCVGVSKLGHRVRYFVGPSVEIPPWLNLPVNLNHVTKDTKTTKTKKINYNFSLV